MVNGNNHQDTLSKAILKLIYDSSEPLETKEIERALTKVKGVTRTKLFYRLMLLRGESAVQGKFVGPGKGVWIWWKSNNGRRNGKNGK